MIRSRFLIPFGALVLGSAVSAAQTYLPKTIQFKGNTEYTDAELMNAAGLKKDVALTVAEMNERTKQLMDTGVFQDISFSFNGQDLVFQIIPAAVLVPPRIDNIPVQGGQTLDNRLRAKFPLYHGKVPVEGTLLDGVRIELEEELRTGGIEARVLAAPFTDQTQDKIIGMSFTISSPDVRVGEIELSGASAELAQKARAALATVIGSPYSNEGSISQIEKALTNFYGERGYVEVAVQVTSQGPPIVDAEGAHVPFAITVTEGAQYKLAGIKLAPGLIVTQDAFDKESGLHTGDVLSLEKLRSSLGFLTREYHNKGCMRARVRAEPAFDHKTGTVSYTVTAVPGPVFTMGILKVVNLPDELRDALIAAWRIPAGSVFNEGAIRGMPAEQNLSPLLSRAFAVASLFYSVKLHDDVKTVDVDLTLERKLP